MNKKHQCDCCNYSTNVLSNYHRHNRTKRHKQHNEKYSNSNLLKNNKILLRNNKICCGTTKKFDCDYCKKDLTSKRNVKQHYKICKEYIKHIAIKAKDDIIQELKVDNKLKTKELELKIKELEAFKKSEKEYFNIIKSLANNTGSGTVNINNPTINNTNTYGIYYVMRNFKDALNFEDVMKPALTNEEINYTRENGAASGCYKLLYDRCVNGIAVENRPFHCTDLARKKYILHTENDWKVDDKGEMILNKTCPKIQKLYQGDKNIDAMNSEEINDYIDDAEQISYLYKNRKKIISTLAGKTYLKNNMK